MTKLKPNVVKSQDKPFRVGQRTYQKLGNVQLDNSGDDFIRLSDVKLLLQDTPDQDEVYLVGNREGIHIYRRLT